MHERDYFRKKARKTGLAEDWSTYRCLRNSVTNSIRRAKESYNRRVENVKNILPGESKKLSPITFDENNNACHDKHRIANMFNRYFVTADHLRESFVSPVMTSWNNIAIGKPQKLIVHCLSLTMSSKVSS